VLERRQAMPVDGHGCESRRLHLRRFVHDARRIT
jgi:hypothetical protein